MDPLVMMESLMQNMPPDKRERFGAMLRIMEMQQTVRGIADKAAERRARGQDWRREFLMSARQLCREKDCRMIDAMLKAIELCEILRGPVTSDAG